MAAVMDGEGGPSLGSRGKAPGLRCDGLSWLTVAGVVALALVAPAKGRAAGAVGILQAVRPGVACVSAAALAKLTLPDGSSRSERPGATEEDKATAKAGGCHPFDSGEEVIATAMRKNTSIVRFDPGDGGGPITVLVPNIDFRVRPVIDGPFTREARRRCPGHGVEFYTPFTDSGLDVQDAFTATLPKAVQDRVAAAVQGACEAGWRCAYSATDDAITKFGLEAKWADYLCAMKPEDLVD